MCMHSTLSLQVQWHNAHKISLATFSFHSLEVCFPILRHDFLSSLVHFFLNLKTCLFLMLGSPHKYSATTWTALFGTSPTDNGHVIILSCQANTKMNLCQSWAHRCKRLLPEEYDMYSTYVGFISQSIPS